MGLRANSGRSTQGLRRNSRRSSYTIHGNFEEPGLANGGNVGLRSTGQGVADFPDDNALLSLVDPEKVQRQQSRNHAQKPSRKHSRATNENEDFLRDQESIDSQGEKLFLRLKRNLVDDPAAYVYSDIRKTPVRGSVEDYRHDRVNDPQLSDSSHQRKRRRQAETLDPKISPSPSRRARRSTRPAVYEYESPSLDDEGKVEVSKSESFEGIDNKQNDKNKQTNDGDKQTNGKNKSQQTSRSGSSGKPEVVDAEIKQVQKQDSKPKGIANNDYCNSCGGTGELLCCETCVRSFHFSCIEPPVMTVEEIPEEEWSCRHCRPIKLEESEREQVSKNLFGPLIIALESHNAVAYQLPTHIRELFAHIQTSKYGECIDEFMKSENIGPGPRLQTKDGKTLLCFKCHDSPLRGKAMAVCSRCQEPWHIDCVNPPLESTPLGYWVCPLHAGHSVELPLRVRNPLLTSVKLKRKVNNNGDIEIDETEESDDFTNIDSDKGAVDREDAGTFSDEEVTRKIAFPAQSSMLPDGSLVAKSSRLRLKSDSDRVVYKLPPRTIKLDFIDAVHKLRADPLRETPTSDFLLALDYLADKPQPDRDAIRNLMHLKLRGPAVSTASAKDNLNTLLDAALDDENEIGQIMAIRKLMQEKGKERLLQILATYN